mmetsp:Transcript_17443/g.43497  ORF Transcript_17443/g.43497 Transcript_17443/m.43497 type:complete len:118 (-) Transcript_17443:36-389(-)
MLGRSERCGSSLVWVCVFMFNLGLKYDDLLIEDEDVTAAVDKLNSSEFSNRNKRIKRAMDLVGILLYEWCPPSLMYARQGLKHKYLNAESQAKVEPFVGYLQVGQTACLCFVVDSYL